MESTQMKRVWHNGPPPHIGWWNASVDIDPYVWRWWNGSKWSQPAFPNHSAQSAWRAARSTTVAHIEWTDYYPANARVPRLEGQWNYNTGVEPEGHVEVVFANGRQSTNHASALWWDVVDKAPYSIVAWRHAR